MPGLWKAWKAKTRLPTLSTSPLGNLAQNRRDSHIPTASTTGPLYKKEDKQGRPSAEPKTVNSEGGPKQTAEVGQNHLPKPYGYRPKRTAHQAVNRVAQAIVEEKTRIIDIDLRAYFDNVQHFLLLEKVARRVQDHAVMHLLKMMLKATGEKGVPQGGVISPLLSNLYLTEVDRMLEKAIATTRRGQYTHVQYARFADDRAPRAQRAEEGPMCVTA
jgi:Reverse transcriptase (RNA-dependent DNA polymerase)